MPGSKKLWEEHLFPSEKIVFLPSVEKTTIFSSGNKSSPQSFSVPGIKFPPRRNIYSIAPEFLERRIKIKSYQPFWCRNFLITHEFGQIFSSFVVKIGCSIEILRLSDIFLHNMAFIWIKQSMSTLKGMETLKIPVSNSHLSRSNTSGP